MARQTRKVPSSLLQPALEPHQASQSLPARLPPIVELELPQASQSLPARAAFHYRARACKKSIADGDVYPSASSPMAPAKWIIPCPLDQYSSTPQQWDKPVPRASVSHYDIQQGQPPSPPISANGSGDTTRVNKKIKYPCPYAVSHFCTATFSTSGHAARHGRKHTGEKDALCPVCNKAFARKDNMKQHQQTYQCSKSVDRGGLSGL
ncbi:hypothetical protein ACJ73_02052 [Blastomyces percursus]|uniref:C2H2-type domain-containing protein n=1 Tax=Blastomyces percursus TaxID=1658174 RepID=A0A1J9QEL9_9EURO|nr:hypothetical protein ACJ73_02052 [Blastomyces percursus]